MFGGENLATDSVWYCVDMEYTQQRQSSDEPCYGRFDIVALSRIPDAKGQHQVALIELKVDSGSYNSKLPKEIQRQIEDGTFSIDRCEVGLGSGIIGHLADFYRFERAGHFSQLREEICQILSTKHKLGFSVCHQQCLLDFLLLPAFSGFLVVLDRREDFVKSAWKVTLGNCLIAVAASSQIFAMRLNF